MGPSAPSFKSERRPAKLVVQASTTVLHRIHMSWRDVLVSYAKTQEPSSSLPDEVLLLSTEHTLTIFDKYPKAKYHFLTLPRLPFADPVSQSDVPQAVLGSLSSLIASKYGLSVLRVLKEASLEVSRRRRRVDQLLDINARTSHDDGHHTTVTEESRR